MSVMCQIPKARVDANFICLQRVVGNTTLSNNLANYKACGAKLRITKALDGDR